MAEQKRDYYESLELQKGASDDEIKKAFRKLAKKYHPDMNPNDKTAEAKFKEINEAYSVLSDPEKKQRYDAYGHAGVDPSFGNSDGGFGGMDFDVSDIFGSFFGGSSRRRGPMRGDDIGYRIMLSFEEAAFGCKKEVTFQRIEQCSSCKGHGTANAAPAPVCPTCNGSGQVKVQQRTPFGIMQSSRTCDACKGSGKLIKTPCKTCNGSGLEKKKKNIEISIPAGIDEGQKVVLKGQGNAGEVGAPSGDLYVEIGVRPHPVFERKGKDVHCEVPITFAEATLGAKIKIPTLEGESEYQIPEGTQTGTVFTLKNKGIQGVNNRSRGDLYIKTIIEVPKNLNENQKKLLKDFEGSLNTTHLSKRTSFFEKVKNAFK